MQASLADARTQPAIHTPLRKINNAGPATPIEVDSPPGIIDLTTPPSRRTMGDEIISISTTFLGGLGEYLGTNSVLIRAGHTIEHLSQRIFDIYMYTIPRGSGTKLLHLELRWGLGLSLVFPHPDASWVLIGNLPGNGCLTLQARPVLAPVSKAVPTTDSQARHYRDSGYSNSCGSQGTAGFGETPRTYHYESFSEDRYMDSLDCTGYLTHNHQQTPSPMGYGAREYNEWVSNDARVQPYSEPIVMHGPGSHHFRKPTVYTDHTSFTGTRGPWDEDYIANYFPTASERHLYEDSVIPPSISDWNLAPITSTDYYPQDNVQPDADTEYDNSEGEYEEPDSD